MKLKLIDFISCDDIRQEVNHKQTLIGIFHDLNFLVKDSEAHDIKIKLGFYLRFLIEDHKSPFTDFSMKSKMKDLQLHEISGKLNIPNNSNNSKMLTLSVLENQFPIPDKGEISFELTFKNDTEEQVIIPDYKMHVTIQKENKDNLN